jgi:putative ABC transport system permease protein
MQDLNGSYHPPKWAIRLLHWYCHDDLIEEIEGDLMELFDRRAKEGHQLKARFFFWWNVMRFFRLSNFKNSTRLNSTIMFRNYIKIGFRSMTKNWSTSLINIFGLSLSVGCFITIFIFIDLQYSMDGFHTKKRDIYQVVMKVDTDNGIEQWGDTPYPLSRMISEDVSGVDGFFRIEFQYANVRYKKNVFREFMVFADPGYLENLDFKVIKGDPNTLNSLDKIVLSNEMAVKYFGDDDPIGKQLNLKFDGGKAKTLEVGAVLEEYPTNNSFGYGFLIPMVQFEQLELMGNKEWDYLTDANFIVLDEKTDPDLVLSFTDPYAEAFNKASDETTALGFRLIPLNQLSETGHEIIGSVANFSHPSGRISLMIIVVLLTLLASFNYMNISVASATKRLKEIGIRKVMGSYKKQIIYQFLTENLLQVMFALIIGTLLCYFLLLPGFNSLIPIPVLFKFSSVASVAGMFVGLLLFIGLVSGAYPSLYISRFMPVDIFRGSQRFGDSSVFSRILLGFQLIIAFLTIVGCFMFADNAIHQRNIEWGYEKQGLISIRTNSEEEFVNLKNEVEMMSEVLEVTSGQHHSGRSYSGAVVKQQETDIRTNILKVSPDYPEKMGMKLKTGRFFNPSLDRSNSPEALVDPLFVKRMGWESAVDQKVKIEGKEYRIVGELAPVIIEQWHAYGDPTPTLIAVNAKEEDRYLVIKTNASDLYAFDEKLEAIWLDIAPNDPYMGEIQANVFDDFYRETKANVTIIVFISIVSTILACLGLFGLLSFNVQKRLKELSVRKVLGATRMSIVRLIARKYSLVVIISFIVGGVGGYFLMIQLIDSIYAEPKSEFVLPVTLAVFIMTATIVLTLTGQILRATRVNPSVNLRSE